MDDQVDNKVDDQVGDQMDEQKEDQVSLVCRGSCGPLRPGGLNVSSGWCVGQDIEQEKVCLHVSFGRSDRSLSELLPHRDISRRRP